MPTKIVLEIYPDLPRHADKGMGMHQKCFGNVPFPTEAWQEAYPCPPKFFRQFMVTCHSKLAKVWACAESVSVIYCSPPRHGRRCIHTH
jgi:hypothetical protein